MTRADRQVGELLADALDAYLQHPAKLNPILRLDNLQNMRPSQPRGLDLGAFVTQLQARINLLNDTELRQASWLLREHNNGRTYRLTIENTDSEEPVMQRRAHIQAELERLQKELFDLQRFPEDTFEDGTVARFSVTDIHEKSWTFAAIKYVGKWYMSTSIGEKVVTWEKLCKLAGDNPIEIASAWQTVVPSKADFEAVTGKSEVTAND